VCLFVGTPGLALRVGLPLAIACAAGLASVWGLDSLAPLRAWIVQ
jgi:hypothetical protein